MTSFVTLGASPGGVVVVPGIYHFAVAVDKDDRLEVLVTVGSALYPAGLVRVRQTASGDWPEAEASEFPFGGMDLQMARNADGRLEAVLIDANQREVWNSYQVQPGGDWSEWSSIDSPDDQLSLEDIALTANKDGRLEMFVTASDHSLWHSWQPTPGARPWTPWSPLGSQSGPVSIAQGPPILVGQNKDGRLEVFVTDHADLWHIWQRPQGGWSGWDPLRHPPSTGSVETAAVASNADGRLEVFCTAGDDLWHIWQRPQGGWSDWSPLDNPGESITSNNVDVRLNATGRLVLVATTHPSSGSEMFQREQVAPNGGWSPWMPLGNPASPDVFLWSPKLVAKADGKLELLMKTDLQRLRHFREASSTPTATTWARPQFVFI